MDGAIFSFVQQTDGPNASKQESIYYYQRQVWCTIHSSILKTKCDMVDDEELLELVKWK